ncbi:alpha/beta fold hydrolase [Sulfitobacter delicatus]|uniref:Pimeloyl-ACP methyl ester carboxylesterase n=1 Tax=Sulfitobacter delicatus TaxID=218672 RepID=A0A1G7VS68_9RHOB|nr:alpha/beta hydrolase [Sulfitobacter delicatus]SDG62441.1 Pimeloyl-ACP methyl ester carboxylesterase [Sulfitobacter delicatus]
MIPEVNARRFGYGLRPALAIHCSLAHSGAWRRVGEALADDLTIRAFDLPMHGKSGDWDGQRNIHDVATDMALSLLEAPMDLIGHSFGATVAMRIAIERPELVRSLTMIEPVYFAAAAQDDPEGMAEYNEQNEAFEAALAEGDRETAARLFNRVWGDGTKWDQIPAPTRAYMVDRIDFIPASSPFLGGDSAGLLAPGMFDRAVMPALLIEGSASPKAAHAINDSLMRRLPNARRVVVEGAGHMVPITHPGEVAGAISDFLAEVPLA